jgi:hypothetical protein
MHAEPALMEQGEDTQSETQIEVAEREVARCFGSIMDVLMPATPPEPKNARIVRQFDLEAAKTDARPMQEEPQPARPRPERRSREEARAFRNRSLRAAAGLD